jgi:hypothetical protein
VFSALPGTVQGKGKLPVPPPQTERRDMRRVVLLGIWLHLSHPLSKYLLLEGGILGLPPLTSHCHAAFIKRKFKREEQILIYFLRVLGIFFRHVA